MSYTLVIAAIMPVSWKRYTVPSGLTVIQWITDFSERIKQLQTIVTATQSDGAKALKVIQKHPSFLRRT